jgi:hypothetical protein
MPWRDAFFHHDFTQNTPIAPVFIFIYFGATTFIPWFRVPTGSIIFIGVQIAARPWREDVSLAAAAWVERELGAFPPPEM